MSIPPVSTALIPYTPPKTAMEFIKSEAEKGRLSVLRTILNDPISLQYNGRKEDPIETDFIVSEHICLSRYYSSGSQSYSSSAPTTGSNSEETQTRAIANKDSFPTSVRTERENAMFDLLSGVSRVASAYFALCSLGMGNPIIPYSPILSLTHDNDLREMNLEQMKKIQERMNQTAILGMIPRNEIEAKENELKQHIINDTGKGRDALELARDFNELPPLDLSEDDIYEDHSDLIGMEILRKRIFKDFGLPVKNFLDVVQTTQHKLSDSVRLFA